MDRPLDLLIEGAPGGPNRTLTRLGVKDSCDLWEAHTQNCRDTLTYEHGVYSVFSYLYFLLNRLHLLLTSSKKTQITNSWMTHGPQKDSQSLTETSKPEDIVLW